MKNSIPYGSTPPKKELKMIHFLKGFGAAFGMVLALGVCACLLLVTKGCVDRSAAEVDKLDGYDRAFVPSADEHPEVLERMYAEGWEFYDTRGNYYNVELIRKKPDTTPKK